MKNISVDELIGILRPQTEESKKKEFRVYFAGKIAKNDWRHSLCKGLREYNQFETDYYAKQRSKANLKINDNIIYNGPFFISCDHGCYHGEATHGNGVNKKLVDYLDIPEEATSPQYVFNTCIRNIDTSDIMFVYINSIEIYGTLWEMGYAYAKQKPIFAYINKEIAKSAKELWFSLQGTIRFKEVNDEHEAFEDFVFQVKNLTGLPTLNIDPEDLATSKQIYKVKKDFKKVLGRELTVEEIDKLKMLTKTEIGYLISVLLE